jgi:hypothetical protein
VREQPVCSRARRIPWSLGCSDVTTRA